jgi:RHS repeat-associated protein
VGNPQTSGGLTSYTPFGFAGAYTDPDGLLYLVNRYYNPATGQFLSVDPDVATTGEPYGYADGNPVDNTDPTGLMIGFETGEGAIIGSRQFLDRVVPTYVAYNPPYNPPLPRTPARKKRAPAKRRAVRKAATRRKATAAKPSAARVDSLGPDCSGMTLKFGACPIESGLAGTTAEQVKDSAIGAALIIGGILSGGLLDVFGGAAATGDVIADATADATADADDSVGASCESFTASTKVLLATGAAIPISQLKPVDKVLATNVRTGKTQAEPVEAVMVHHDTDRYDLTIKSGRRTAVIDTTRSHLFWDQTTRQWTKAAALRHHDHLRTPSGVTATVVGGHIPADSTGWMWDLSVPGGNDHDFYIDTTITAVLVHNCDDPFENTQYTQKVQEQMQQGDYHSFPELVKSEVTPGDVSTETGGDGETYTHVRIPGSIRDTEGEYHWIIDEEGMINHRQFEPF